MQLFGAPLKLRRLLVDVFGSWSHCAIRHPRSTLAVALLLTLAAVPGLPRLRLRTDGNALVAPNAPEVLYDQEIRRRFGIEDNIVVCIRSREAEGIFNPGTVQLVRELTRDFQALPGINSNAVLSLATEPSFRMRPGTLIQQRLLTPELRTRAELDLLREDLRRIELYTGTLVATDGKATAILVGVPGGSDRPGLYRQVVETIEAKRPVPEEIAVTGAPVAESLLGTHILEDLGVPARLLGASTHGRAEQLGWRWPGSFYELRRLIAQRVGLVPVAALVMMLVLWGTFRNLPAALVPLPGVAATLVFVFGLMGWCGVPIYLTVAVMPVLLTAIGVTNDIYLFSRYFALLRERPDAPHLDLVRETFDKLVVPVAITSLTSAIGFFSFGFSPLGPVRAFGFLSGIGVLFGLVYSLTVVPAMLVLLNPRWFCARRGEVGSRGGEPDRGRDPDQEPDRGRGRERGRLLQGRLAGGFGRLAEGVVRWRWGVVALTLLVLGLTPFGLRRLVVQDSWTDAFDSGSEFYQATRMVNQEFHGMHLLYVSLDAPEMLTGQVPASALSPNSLFLTGSQLAEPALIAGNTITFSLPKASPADGTTSATAGAIWKPRIEMGLTQGTNCVFRFPPTPPEGDFWPELARVGKAEFSVPLRSHLRPDLIRAAGELGEYLRQCPAEAVGGVLGPYDYLTTTRFMVRPSDPGARRLPDTAGEIKLMWDYYGLGRGPHRLRQVVDTNYWTSLTTVFLKEANFIDTARLMRKLRDYEHEQLTPKGIRLGFAGDVAVSQSLIGGIVATQMHSLLWSLVGIGVVTAVLGGSLRWGLYCLVPSLLAVLIKFALMGESGIPLGVATSMFAAMTLGIGVNCAIHLLENYRQAQAGGLAGPAALSRSLALTGPPALLNSVAVSLGFGVLTLSQVPANARLGILLVVGLANCFFVSLALLPVLLHWWPLLAPKTTRPS